MYLVNPNSYVITSYSIHYTKLYDRLCKASENKHKREYFRVLNVAKPINNTSYEGVLSFLSHMNLDLPNTFDDIDCGNRNNFV